MDYKRLLRDLRDQGFRVDLTGKGHVRAAPPDLSRSIVHFAMSDEPRAFRNTIADLRKSGFVWHHGGAKDARCREDDDVERPEPPEPDEPEEDDRVPESPEPIADMTTLPDPLAAPAEPAPPLDTTLDGLYAALREARLYQALAAAHVVDLAEAAAKAQRALAEAEAEAERAREALRSAKERFDAAFAAG